MNREELLRDYFHIDVDSSGNEDCNQFKYRDTNHSYWKRVVPRLITSTKKTEFDLIMNTLLPDWETDKSLFSLEHVAYRPHSLCICTKEISDVCLLKHPSLADGHGLQVGNNCVHKINPELAKRATSIHNKMREERRIQREEDEFQKELELYLGMESLDIWKTISLQLGITFAKKESEDYKRIKVKFERVKSGLLKLKNSKKKLTHTCYFTYMGDDYYICHGCGKTE